MFEIEGLPDLFVHTQLKLSSTAPIAPGAIVRGVIDLDGLTFLEAPTVAANFAAILTLDIAPQSGLQVLAPAHRTRLTPDLPNAVARRFDVHRRVHFQLTNISDDPLMLTDVPMTLCGIALPPSKDLPVVIWPALVPDDDVLSATSMDGVALASTWTIA